MKPCFGYIRVSTLRQGEGVSLEAQREAIVECAAARGLTIIEWFEELETASKEGRPIFNRMVKRLHRKHAEGLIVHKLDRSSRNIQDWGVVSRLMDDGIAFHIATEPIDFTTRGGRMTADFLAIIAADFSRNQREETQKGQRIRLKQGLYLDYGILELDNNTAERAMRSVAIGCKNYLFVGSQTGGRAAAIAYTLIETAKLNDVDPQAWLADRL